MPADIITRRFDKAAGAYGEIAMMQVDVARYLVDWAKPANAPADILDIGSGTGFVASMARKRWPNVAITALDSAPNMLIQAQQKIPDLKIVNGDAYRIDLDERFDMIFCSMLLHWLPDPRKALQRWQRWLKPNGKLYVACLVDGSFDEWRKLCAMQGVKDGLWPMPREDFTEGLASRAESRILSVSYSSAKEFLSRLKRTGASTPRNGHEPLNVSVMRRMLDHAPKPFVASHRIAYIELPSSPNI